MPSISDLIVAAIGILAIVAFALVLAPTVVWARRRLFGSGEPQREVRAEGALESKVIVAELGATGTGQGTDDEAGEPAGTPGDSGLEDRVVRIVSWAFLMAVAVFAAAAGIWGSTLPAIVILIAVTGEALLILQDVVPRTPFRRMRGPLQGILAITFAGILVALTGGLTSPFTFTFPLIVGAGALLVAPRVALVLAVLATGAYLMAGMVASPNPGTESLVLMAVNLTGLFLLAYIGASVGREQRRVRDAAIKLSTVDFLTGLSNRTFFFAALEREIARGDRSGRGVLPRDARPRRSQGRQRSVRPRHRRPGPPQRRGHRPQRRPQDRRCGALRRRRVRRAAPRDRPDGRLGGRREDPDDDRRAGSARAPTPP